MITRLEMNHSCLFMLWFIPKFPGSLLEAGVCQLTPLSSTEK